MTNYGLLADVHVEIFEIQNANGFFSQEQTAAKISGMTELRTKQTSTSLGSAVIFEMLRPQRKAPWAQTGPSLRAQCNRAISARADIQTKLEPSVCQLCRKLAHGFF